MTEKLSRELWTLYMCKHCCYSASAQGINLGKIDVWSQIRSILGHHSWQDPKQESSILLLTKMMVIYPMVINPTVINHFCLTQNAPGFKSQTGRIPCWNNLIESTRVQIPDYKMVRKDWCCYGKWEWLTLVTGFPISPIMMISRDTGIPWYRPFGYNARLGPQ